MNMERRRAATVSSLIFLPQYQMKEEKRVLLKVQGVKEGEEFWYWMGRKLTHFKDLMRDYSQRIGVAVNSLGFFYGGSPINPIFTADFLKMEDGDIIYAIACADDAVTASESTLISLSRMKEENPILIGVQGLRGDKLFFWIGRNTPLLYLMLNYCFRTGVFIESMRFVYSRDKCRIDPDKTADDLKMEDEDLIHAFMK